ncbi:hypothetical protein ABW55_08290 [Acinetobacter sp. C15]|nr:hypothetical protein ABW55_08290 [Acinetobacter sp. C15]
MSEFNTPPIRVPAIPPTIGGKLKDFATVVPNAANVAGVPRLDKAVFDCDGFASTNMTFGE